MARSKTKHNRVRHARKVQLKHRSDRQRIARKAAMAKTATKK